jgi:hypothetical protein
MARNAYHSSRVKGRDYITNDNDHVAHDDDAEHGSGGAPDLLDEKGIY